MKQERPVVLSDLFQRDQESLELSCPQCGVSRIYSSSILIGRYGPDFTIADLKDELVKSCLKQAPQPHAGLCDVIIGDP